MSQNNQQVDRGDLKKNLSEKFVWAIAYGSCIGWGAFILPGDWIGQSGYNCSSDWYCHRCIVNDTYCSELRCIS